MTILAILLTAVFVTLKVTHVIAWSWLVVFAPLYVAAVFMVVFVICGALLLNVVAKGIFR